MPTKPNKFDGSNLRKFETFGKTDSDSLVFPIDLEDQLYYPECIKFGIYERTGLSFEKLGDAAAKEITAISNGIIGKEARASNDEQIKALQEQIDERSGEIAGLENIERGRATLAQKELLQVLKENDVRAKEEQRRINPNLFDAIARTTTASLNNLDSQNKARLKQIENPSTRLKQNIYLQMPESLIYNEQIDWQGSDLGIVGAFKEGQLGAGAFAGALSNAGKILGGTAGTVASIIPGVGTFAAGILGTVLGGETGLAGGIESTFNVKANPYKEQTFQGVPFRPFEFSFNFRPRNDTEVEAVDDIIRSFRAYSKPSFKTQGASGVFAYPHEFLIEFLTLDEGEYYRNEYIPQIKFCVCKSVNTNWTGQGWKSFRDGAPIDITLTLSFEETEIVTQEDVLGRTNAGDFSSFKGNF